MGKSAVLAIVGLAEDIIVGGLEAFDGALLPEVRFHAAEAAEEPFAIDQRIDEHALFGGGGLEAAVIFEFEGFEVGGYFATDNLGFGVDAGFESISR